MYHNFRWMSVIAELKVLHIPSVRTLEDQVMIQALPVCVDVHSGGNQLLLLILT